MAAVGPRERIEEALRTRFAREDLAVYADLLLQEGDPRGELIALDLDPKPSPAWQARRREVLEGWLGPAVASISHHVIRLGFIGELGDGKASLAILASPAGAFVRAFRTRGETSTVRLALAKLAAAPRPWLTELTIERWSMADDVCVGRALVDELIAQLPALTALEISGRRVVHAFAHPGVTTLRVSGNDALGWGRMPAVTRLDLASAPILPAWRTRTAEVHVPAVPLDATQLPALTHLDLSRDEPRVDEPARIWDALLDWPVRTQITHLVLPSFDEDDIPRIARTLDAMPALVDVRVVQIHGDHGDELRARTPPVVIPPRTPWPRPRTVQRADALTVLVDDHRVDVDLHSIINYLDTTRPVAARHAWTQFWDFVTGLETGDLVPFPFAILDETLASCGDDIEDAAERWADLRLQLRIARPRMAPDASVYIQRAWLDD